MPELTSYHRTFVFDTSFTDVEDGNAVTRGHAISDFSSACNPEGICAKAYPARQHLANSSPRV